MLEENKDLENEIVEEVETLEVEVKEEVKKTVPPVKYIRPPAFVKWWGFTKQNKNNFYKPTIRKSAARGR